MAMRYIEDVTCITFPKRNKADPEHTAYVSIKDCGKE
jgi:hypothetical protein